VEREFLALWSTDDGAFRGMFEPLRAHGASGARVLAAIALDRRLAGEAVLSFGPYAWREPSVRERDRSECRYRALEALADCGTVEVREWLRGSLRAEPAPEFFDDADEDPIPAALDDALRETIAALGDPEPLWRLIHASEGAATGLWSETFELRRRAGAYAVLGSSAAKPAVRRAHYERAVELFVQSMTLKNRVGIAVDGVEHYNLACHVARRDGPGDRAQAIVHLERAVRTYAVSSRWLARDGDLRTLRDEPAFGRLLENLRARERALEEPPR
jgi:hypothetical protein